MANIIEEVSNFYYFSDEDHKLINEYLEEHFPDSWTPTLCGNCCGMFTEFYNLKGLMGEDMTQEESSLLIKFLDDNKIKCMLTRSTLYPDEHNEYITNDIIYERHAD